MEQETVRIRLKVNANEIEIEATKNSLKDVVQAIPDILRNISSLPPKPSVEPVKREPQVEEKMEELPEIKIEKDESLPSVITKLFATEWGRKPRKLMDVKEALESYGLIYPRQSVAVALLRLAKDGKLRRFKGPDEEYVYTASTVLLAK